MRFVLAIAAATAMISISNAQTNPPSPYPMPGTVVGRPALLPVGSAFPKVGNTIGTPIGYNGPNGEPVNPGQRPPGQIINLNNLAAPLAAPLPADLVGTPPKTYLQKLYDKWRDMLGFSNQPTVTNNWTPGLSRRNRERHKEKDDWQRN
jgi:hypothetical protein